MRGLSAILFFCLPLSASDLPLDQMHASEVVPDHAVASLKLPESAMIGEEIAAKLVIENKGAESFAISLGGDYRATGYPQRIKVQVHDGAGNKLTELPPEAYGFGGGGLMMNKKLEPGEREEIAFPLECYVSFPGAGIYTVTAGHDLGWKVGPEHRHPLGVAQIEVVEPDEQQAAELVDRIFGAQADSKPDDESDRLSRKMKLAHQLCVLRHPVYTVPLQKRAVAGSIEAVQGIGHIASPEATRVLIDLLDHSSSAVVVAACRQMQKRIPTQDDGFLVWASRFQIDPLLPVSWKPEFEKALSAQLPGLIKQTDPDVLTAAGRLLELRGSEEHVPAILEALQVSLDTYRKPVSGPNTNTLDAPPPEKALIAALDSLREKGWRAERPGGTAQMVAWFRQLADEDVPKPVGDDWRNSMLTWVENGPATLKVCALQAIPLPLSDEAAIVVGRSLEDADWRVLRVACEVAGKSGRPEFALPLTQIVEIGDDTFLQYAAHEAALACGARAKLWDAWASVIIEKSRMVDALGALIVGTIDIEPGGGSGGSSNFTREQRFAIRDAWRAFLQEHHDQLAAGKKIPSPGSSTVAALTGINFRPDNPAIRIDLKDGGAWPSWKR